LGNTRDKINISPAVKALIVHRQRDSENTQEQEEVENTLEHYQNVHSEP